MADSPMGWVRSTTLSKEEETEAHWTCCNPDKFAELALMLFTSLIHLLPTYTKNNQCEDRKFEVHCYLKRAIQTLGLSVPS